MRGKLFNKGEDILGCFDKTFLVLVGFCTRKPAF